jgi:ABC-2 type transport system ATP-binding protein
MSYAIETENLSKTYQSYQKPEGLWNSIRGFWDRKYVSKTALHPTTLKIERGQIIGLVGANGAGKTTLLKLLSGLVHPSSGDAKVLGYRPWERKDEFLRRMSILLGQKNQLWWDIAPLDSFMLLSEIYDLDRAQAKKRVQDLAQILDCTHVLQTQLRRLSLGERMKMELIGALIHEPEILFLDEPTIGLDIVAQTSIRRFLAEYVRQKKPTVILTSHYMDDISKLADQLYLISRGQIVYTGTIEGFIEKSENLQKISFDLLDPLAESLKIENQSLNAGQQDFQFQLKPNDVPAFIAKASQIPGFKNLKIEEADFEDTIRAFLEKESGLR